MELHLRQLKVQWPLQNRVVVKFISFYIKHLFAGFEKGNNIFSPFHLWRIATFGMSQRWRREKTWENLYWLSRKLCNLNFVANRLFPSDDNWLYLGRCSNLWTVQQRIAVKEGPGSIGSAKKIRKFSSQAIKIEDTDFS